MVGRYYTYTSQSLQPETSLGYLIVRCSVLMRQIAERALESQPISLTQWQILALLTQCSHVSPTELSEHLGHDMGALTRVVDELERDGLVRRERSERDRRAVEIAITPEGRRLAFAGKRFIVDLLNELVEPYSTAEVDALISLLQRLMSRLQAVARAAAPAKAVSAAPGQRGTPRAAARRPRTMHAAPRRKPLE